jgi:hypothetical protein
MNWGEVRNVWVTRLLKKEKTHWLRPVHEIVEVEGRSVHSSLTISHFSHNSISSFWTKVISYAQLEAELRHKEGRQTSVGELLIWPAAKFGLNFWLKGGFLDGWRGLIYATLMSVHSFSVRAMLYEKNH